MKFEELPGIPKMWLEFLHGSMPFLPASKSIPALVASANAARLRDIRRDALCLHLENDDSLCFDGTLGNLQKLRQPESVVVLTNFYPALFGGPAFQLFKCLTAVKLCEELSRHNLQAIPVCWISDAAPRAFSKWSVRLLNSESELYLLEVKPRGADAPLPGDVMKTLLAGIERAGNGNFDPETLEVLGASFGDGTTLARASARLVAELMQEWGMIVLDPRSYDFGKAGSAPRHLQDASLTFSMQRSILPVIATVIDPFEVESFAGTQTFFEEHKLAGPMAWPQASATVIDSRSRRILNRHGLDLKRLYAGADAIVGEIVDAMPRGVSETLAQLKLEAETKIAALGELDSAGGQFAKDANSGKRKIVYQLDRLRQRFETACRDREQTVRRQIRRACNSLAPEGRIQELDIGGVQLPLRYSRAGLRSLYNELDIMSLKHQLIYMD